MPSSSRLRDFDLLVTLPSPQEILWMLRAPPCHLTASVQAVDFQFYNGHLCCPLLKTLLSPTPWARPAAHKKKCWPPSLPWDSPHPILWSHVTKLWREANFQHSLSTFIFNFIQQKKWFTAEKKKSTNCFKFMFFHHMWIFHLKKSFFFWNSMVTFNSEKALNIEADTKLLLQPLSEK